MEISSWKFHVVKCIIQAIHHKTDSLHFNYVKTSHWLFRGVNTGTAYFHLRDCILYSRRVCVSNPPMLCFRSPSKVIPAFAKSNSHIFQLQWKSKCAVGWQRLQSNGWTFQSSENKVPHFFVRDVQWCLFSNSASAGNKIAVT